jgi:hypothetical protein
MDKRTSTSLWLTQNLAHLPGIFLIISSAFMLDVHVIWLIATFVIFMMAPGNTHIHLKFLILVVCQLLKRILQNASQLFSTIMHTLIVHYTIAASRQLQSGVVLIAKCGGISFITA